MFVFDEALFGRGLSLGLSLGRLLAGLLAALFYVFRRFPRSGFIGKRLDPVQSFFLSRNPCFLNVASIWALVASPTWRESTTPPPST